MTSIHSGHLANCSLLSPTICYDWVYQYSWTVFLIVSSSQFNSFADITVIGHFCITKQSCIICVIHIIWLIRLKKLCKSLLWKGKNGTPPPPPFSILEVILIIKLFFKNEKVASLSCFTWVYVNACSMYTHAQKISRTLWCAFRRRLLYWPVQILNSTQLNLRHPPVSSKGLFIEVTFFPWP